MDTPQIWTPLKLFLCMSQLCTKLPLNYRDTSIIRTVNVGPNGVRSKGFRCSMFFFIHLTLPMYL